jgi:hypothetical protein
LAPTKRDKLNRIDSKDPFNEVGEILVKEARELPKFAQLSSIILVKKEFEKTPKRNIKRYLYT